MAESKEVSMEPTIKQETLDVVTKELLETAIRERDGLSNVTVHSFTTEAASKIGDNMATVALRVKADVEREGTRNDESFVFKVAKEIKFGNDKDKFNYLLFSKEIGVYTKLLPAFAGMQEKLGVDPVVPVTPKFYFGRVGGNGVKALLMLEDMCPKGFQVGDKFKGYGIEESKLVMKELATWHALSLALKNKDLDAYKSEFEFGFSEVLFGSVLGNHQRAGLASAVKQFVSTVKQSALCSDEMKERAAKLETMDPFESIQNILKPVEPFSLVTHGDAWGNNMLFKRVTKDGAAEPVAVALIDFQICRYALPTIDLAYFLYFNTSRELRKLRLKELLKVYHEKFVAVLHHVQFPCPELTLDVVESMFKQTAIFGWFFAVMAVPYLCMSKEDIKKLHESMERMTAEEMADAAKVDEVRQKAQQNSKAAREKALLELLEDAIELELV